MNTQSSSSRRPRPRTLRLSFAYGEAGIQLLTAHRLAIKAPPSIDTADFGPHAGFWYELQDDQGNVHYRRPTQDPLANSIEIHSPDPDEPPMRRVSIEQTRGTFTLDVPEFDHAHILVFFRSPDDPVGPTGLTLTLPAIEFVRFDLSTYTIEEGWGYSHG
ncbi:MAG TPA: hypothetical protein VH593_31570 [Ktedonobacteraceae bacterium]